LRKHLQRDLDQIKREVLKMGSLVSEALDRAMTAIVSRRKDLATAVIDGDDVLDNQEVIVENEVLKALALHQPVAADLRFLVTVLKVNNDLERMGDLAVNIAERARYLAGQPPLSVPLQFKEMVDRVREMVRASLDALVEQSADLARWVCRADSQVDARNREMFDAVQKVMKEDPENIERGVMLLSTCRHLERIADHATNIAEDVVYLVEGEVVRHSKAVRRLGDEPGEEPPAPRRVPQG
jgi:phosphate transport system protein